ncbi:GntR family transcriptional regulator [Brevibacillus ruminantium]|uniref:GntR family transcriptional regulator n=1 Tax=Brevibacillus ruminantium TaxID=2950604 RepID=A0ABY4W968_9BACL|nr:GntR family transcriptional regulator [Brevibacillus ruminantium]USG63329.1 GntR family transcriptional regulator [Brevibacillus ruminantium]
MKIIKPLERPVLRDQIYEYLKKAIITLELAPGQRIKDSDLAADFGVSRTPVREALKRLEDEGLVESAPGSLTRISPIHMQEAKHAFTVVATLHALAARLAVPVMSEQDCADMEEKNRQLAKAMQEKNMIRAVEADDAFHQVFLEVCGNREIDLALERIVPKIRRLEFAKFSSLEGLRSVEQHVAIIEACKAQDAGKAAQLTEENWLSLGRVLTAES